MSAMEIRIMRSEDEPKAYSLISESLDEYFAPQVITFFRMQWPAGQIVACDLFGNILCYLAGTKLPNGRVSIHLFATSAGNRGRGIGTMVLNRFKQAALMEGFTSIQLEVKEHNTRAMEFYKRNGFVPVEFLESFYNDGSSGVRMVCDLNDRRSFSAQT